MIVTKVMVPGTGKTQTEKYSFKAESENSRDEWVSRINVYTKNLDMEKLDIVTEEEKQEVFIDQILEDIFTQFNNEMVDNQLEQKYDKLAALRETN